MSRSKRILEAALKENTDDLILSSEGENNNSLGEGTSKREEAYQMQGQTDSNDLITLSDLEESCDDSVVDPDFSPDIIPNSDSSDEESCINIRKFIMTQKNSARISKENIPTETSFPPCSTSLHFFIAAYPGPVISADNYDPDIDYLTIEETSTSPTEQNVLNPIPLNIITNNNNKQKLKHPMITKDCRCTRECMKFTPEERQNIWNNYWDLPCKSRRPFLNKCVTIHSVKRRKTNQDSSVYLKTESRYYALPKMIDGNQTYKPVCRQFLLNTLGYTNDSVITELSKATKTGALVLEDKRGGRRKVVQRQPIQEHIMSYHPIQSHYRRHNAPITRYLPRHLTITHMHTDFRTKYPDFDCGTETYRKALKDMRVSLFMPKSDTCVECEMHKNSDGTATENDSYNEHKIKAESAINMYKSESQLSNSIHTKYYSMDLQKVILLPEMPNIKESHFVSRLITFNLTFAPIQPKSKNEAVCVLWHEAIAGREAHNIIDAIWAFLDSERNVKNFHLWADNCTAQNKNWYLYTALVIILNSCQNEIENLTISYLTKGHTHMSADSVHGNIEKKMHRNQAVFDFEDLKSLIRQARMKIRIVEPQNYHDWPKKKREPRSNSDPLKNFQLNSIVQVKFVRGMRQMLYKTSFNEPFVPLDFMIKKFDPSVWPASRNEPRGIKTSKKEEIIKELVKLMPESRKKFWQDLPVNDRSPDLVNE